MEENISLIIISRMIRYSYVLMYFSQIFHSYTFRLRQTFIHRINVSHIRRKTRKILSITLFITSLVTFPS